MLHPLQLEKISALYSDEVADIRDFLQTLGISVETTDALANTATELRTNASFRRNLAMHVWALLHTPGREVSTPDTMAILAVAAGGPLFASQSYEQDSFELLRFVMETHEGIEPRAPLSAQPIGVEASRKIRVQAVSTQAPHASKVPSPASEIPFHAAPGQVKAVRMVQDGDNWGFEPRADLENEDLLNISSTRDKRKDWRMPIWGAFSVFLILGLCFAFWLQDRLSSASITVPPVPEITAQPASVAAMKNNTNQSIFDSSEPVLDPFRVMSAKPETSDGVAYEARSAHNANESEDETLDRRIALPGTNPDHTDMAATSRRSRRPNYIAAGGRTRGPALSNYEPGSNTTQDTSGSSDQGGPMSDGSGSVTPTAESSALATHPKTLGSVAHSLWHGLRHGIGKVF
jgi:hypothetical protein